MLLRLKIRLQAESLKLVRSFIIARISGRLLVDQLIAMLLLEGFH